VNTTTLVGFLAPACAPRAPKGAALFHCPHKTTHLHPDRLALAYHLGGVVMPVGSAPPEGLEGLLLAQGFRPGVSLTALFRGSHNDTQQGAPVCHNAINNSRAEPGALAPNGTEPSPAPLVHPAIIYAVPRSPFLRRALVTLSGRGAGVGEAALGQRL
jgi:hypothetical protein